MVVKAISQNVDCPRLVIWIKKTDVARAVGDHFLNIYDFWTKRVRFSRKCAKKSKELWYNIDLFIS